MTHIDDELRTTLRRVDPPHGFADRVRARVKPNEPSAATPQLSRLTLSLRLAMAATLVVAAGGGVWYRQEQRRTQGEEAKRQVLLSLNIAGSKLRAIEMKVNHTQER
jgi:hypothetical protein